FNVAGANPCARTAPLEMTRSEMVVKAKKAGRFSTDARYAGNRGFWQAFFPKKFEARKSVPLPSPDTLATACARRLLVVGKIIRRKPRRRREHLVTVNENAPVAPRRELVFVRVRRDDPGAT